MERLRDYLLDTRKFALSSGLGLTTGSTVRSLSIASGSYYVALDKIAYAGAYDPTFSMFYGAGGLYEQSGLTQINITQYDAAGTLTPITLGYRTDTVFLTSDGRISIIYGTAQYADPVEAAAAPEASAPSFISPTGFPMYKLVVQLNVGIVNTIDIRPPVGGTGSGGGASDHHRLSNLDMDDHTQYLLVSGSRAMGGDLQMGGHNITGGTALLPMYVDTVAVRAHASRHNPGGLDPLAVAAPVHVQVGATEFIGDTAYYSLSNHQHGIDAGIPTYLHETTSSEGTAVTVARSDHHHWHGNLAIGVGTHHAVANHTYSGFMPYTDKIKLDAASTVPGANILPLSDIYSKLDAWVTADVSHYVSATYHTGNLASFYDTSGRIITDSGYKGSDFATYNHDHYHVYEPYLPTKGTLAGYPTNVVTISGTAACLFASATVNVAQATTVAPGYVSAADFLTFTNKVSGPLNAVTDNALARWDTTTGTLIQNSSAILGDNGRLSLSGLILRGSTSGTTQIMSYESAASWTMYLPSAVGTAGYVMYCTDSAGSTGWLNPPWGYGTVTFTGTAPAANEFPAFNDTTGTVLKRSTYSAASFALVDHQHTKATENVFVGTGALDSVTPGSYNTAVGYNALTNTNSAAAINNVAVGDGALIALNSGSDNVAVGYSTGSSVTTATQCVFIGSYAGSKFVTGSDNAFIGFLSGANATSVYNVGIGTSSLGSLLSGGYNTAIGQYSGYVINSGTNNICVGVNGARGLTSGNYNIAIGNGSLGGASYSVTTDNNTVIGHACMTRATAAANNVVIGNNAMGLATAGVYGSPVENVAIGIYALYSAVGSSNMEDILPGRQNVAVGYSALRYSTSGYSNTAVGWSAMGAGNPVTGTNNVAVGTNAGLAITSGTNNTLLGADAGKAIAGGLGNTCVGEAAGKVITSGGGNTCLGVGAGISIVGGSNHVCIGNVAGASMVSTATGIVCVGASAGNKLVSGSLTAVGNDAAKNLTASLCTAVGDSALYTGVGAHGNTAIGYRCLFTCDASSGGSSGVYNVAVGCYALTLCTGGTNSYSGSFNVAVGVYAGSSLSSGTTTDAYSNTFIGSYSGNSITSGYRNTCIGDSAGRSVLTTGYNNTLMGYDSLTGAADTNYAVAIGDLCRVATSSVAIGHTATAIGTNSVSIGNVVTSSSANTVAIGDSLSAAVSSSVLIGTTASVSVSYGISIGFTAASAGGVAIGHTVSAGTGIAIGTSVTATGNGINIGSTTSTAAGVLRLGILATHTTAWVSAAAWTYGSDLRLKSDVRDSELGLDFITKLRPVSYRMKRLDESGAYVRDASRRDLGFIAQEIKGIEGIDAFRIVMDPKVNDPETNDYMGLNYNDLMAPIVKAIQEQQAIIEDLKAQLAAR